MATQVVNDGMHPDDPEQIIARFRTHGRALVLPITVLLVLAPAAGYFIGWFEALWQNILVILGAALIFVFGVCAPLLSWLTTRATITTKRLIIRQGIFTRQRSEVPFTRVRTVSSTQSIFQRMFGSGNVYLEVSEGVPMSMRDVPSVRIVTEALQQLLERSYRAQTRAQGFFTRAF